MSGTIKLKGCVTRMRRLTALALSLVLCLGLLPMSVDAVSFSDVPESYWAYTDIQELCER